MLVELDGVLQGDEGDVLLLAATVSPAHIDAALLRPGRLDVHIGIEPPTRAQRRALLGQMLADTPLSADVDVDALAASSEGFSLAQLSATCREAAMCALRSGDASVSAHHLAQVAP